MKITNWAIIFLFLMLPAYFYLQWNDEDSRNALWLTERYDQALTTSVEDSILALRQNANPNNESSYNSMKYTNVNKEKAIDTFFNTLAINFNTKGDSINEDILKHYVPVVAVMEYDGLSLNVYNEYKDKKGQTNWKREWLPKIPFAYEDEQGNVFSFTVDDSYLKVYSASTGMWYDGTLEQIFSDMTLYDDATRTWTTDKTLIQSIPFLKEFTDENGEPLPSKWLDKKFVRSTTMDKVRRETIVSTVQDQLSYYINQHNTYARSLGIDYRFTLPLIPEEDWINTVDDISTFAFIQGIPITKEHTYNNYAFVGARVQKNVQYAAGVKDGMKVYFREDTKADINGIDITRKFTTAKSAAAEGYFPLEMIRQ